MHRSLRIFIASLFFIQCFASTAHAGHGEHKPDKKGILLVAFGTSIPEAQHALDNIGRAAAEAFPGVDIRWAWTSPTIRAKVLREQGLRKESVARALADMLDEGFTRVAVQSLHTIPGEEYHDMVTTAYAFRPLGMGVVVGSPLMATSEDVAETAQAILATVPKDRKPDEAVVLMGHGTHHPGDVYYSALQYALSGMDDLVLVGTVDGRPTYEDVLTALKKRDVRTVWLMPFMSVAGDHALNDMAGSEEDSWASMLADEGIRTHAVLKGTAEYDEFVRIWIGHLQSAYAHFE